MKNNPLAGSLQHTSPCNECPWRKKAPAGWLGGNAAEMYADLVQSGIIPPCHKTQESENPAFCAGALSVMKHQCIIPYHQAGSREAIGAIKADPDCFKNVGEFFSHHSNGERYVQPILRQIRKQR